MGSKIFGYFFAGVGIGILLIVKIVQTYLQFKDAINETLSRAFGVSAAVIVIVMFLLKQLKRLVKQK